VVGLVGEFEWNNGDAPDVMKNGGSLKSHSKK
jgi:hypothetical protein